MRTKKKNTKGKWMNNGMNGVKNEINEIKLHKALMFIEDILERAVCPYFILRDTAKSIVDSGELKGKDITVGILKKYITKEVLWTFKSLLKDIKLTDNGFTYLFGEVPIIIKFINKHYKFFDNPDFKWYKAGQYNIANPFERYWKSRFFIT